MNTLFVRNFTYFTHLSTICSKSINLIIFLILTRIYLDIGIIISLRNILRIFNILPGGDFSTVSIKFKYEIMSSSYSYFNIRVELVSYFWIFLDWNFRCTNCSLTHLEEIIPIMIYMNLEKVFLPKTYIERNSIVFEILCGILEANSNIVKI